MIPTPQNPKVGAKRENLQVHIYMDFYDPKIEIVIKKAKKRDKEYFEQTLLENIQGEGSLSELEAIIGGFNESKYNGKALTYVS